MTEQGARMDADIGQRIGRFIIAACDASFGWHNRLATMLTGRHVETIGTQELAKAQNSGEDSSIVLVDVRDEAERAVSMIPGAISVATYEADRERFAGKTIVPYCTVGGRSYLYARKLAAQGVPTKNYRDSILGWCRAGLPLATDEGMPTNSIHTYWSIFRVPKNYDPRS